MSVFISMVMLVLAASCGKRALRSAAEPTPYPSFPDGARVMREHAERLSR